jgi:hypothetical protein
MSKSISHTLKTVLKTQFAHKIGHLKRFRYICAFYDKVFMSFLQFYNKCIARRVSIK